MRLSPFHKRLHTPRRRHFEIPLRGTVGKTVRFTKDIRRVARKQYGAEEKIRIVLDGLRGEESIVAREGIAESLYYNWSKAPKSRAIRSLSEANS
jgi:transposase-like protein